MALPVAHWALALGMVGHLPRRGARRAGWVRRLSLVFLALLAVLPDFDFALVWGLNLPSDSYHRTFSHSLLFFSLVVLLWTLVRPAGLKESTPGVCFLILLSHSLLDMLCTLDPATHGVMLFWPFHDYRFGWPVLVPLYRLFAESPFSVQGALRFTFLEVMLAVPLWVIGRLLGKVTAKLTTDN